jgi:maltose/moltooligosaccharide transporter
VLAHRAEHQRRPALLPPVDADRGLGAKEGQTLGSVPAHVTRNAICEVLVVQTSALDEERLFRTEATGTGADRPGSMRLTDATVGQGMA